MPHMRVIPNYTSSAFGDFIFLDLVLDNPEILNEISNNAEDKGRKVN